MSVSWYSTRHVGNTVTVPWRLVRLIFGRFSNQVENRCLAYGGSSRTGDTPVALATTLRIAKSSWTGLRDPAANSDNLYVFVDGDEQDVDDDVWQQVAVTAVSSGNNCGGTPSFDLTVGALPAVTLNTPVRLFEVMELKLHQADGQWWLGARSVKTGENTQPVLGPLTAGGFALTYLGSNGAVTADKNAVKSIRVSVRGLTEDAVRANGSGTLGRPEETLVTQVLLRNSIRP